MDCLFCKIIEGEIPSYTVYEDELVKVFLDIHPTTNGDLLMIPKQHTENLDTIDETTLHEMMNRVKKLYPSILQKLGASGLTISQNNGYGQEIKHFHIHMTPRYENDELMQSSNQEILKDVKDVWEDLKNL